jgi:hypothetical protein
VYDAINEHEELPNIEYPDSDSEKSIVEFHACKYCMGNSIPSRRRLFRAV